MQEKIIANYARHGYACAGERHLRIQDNFSFSEVTTEQIRTLIREVAKDKPDAISVFCTNLRAAPLVADLEAELGIPIYDTISTVVWKSLKLSGADPNRVTGWGRLFRKVG